MQTTRDNHSFRSPSRTCEIAPPDLLDQMIRDGSSAQRDAALATLAASASMRSQRSFLSRVRRELGTDAANTIAGLDIAPERHQTVYDNENQGRSNLPGRRARGEDEPAVEDVAVNEAYDGSGATYDFYNDCLGRDSLDGAGMELGVVGPLRRRLRQRVLERRADGLRRRQRRAVRRREPSPGAST